MYSKTVPVLVRGSVREAVMNLDVCPKAFSALTWISSIYVQMSMPNVWLPLCKKTCFPAFSGDIILLLWLKQWRVCFTPPSSAHPVMWESMAQPSPTPDTVSDGKGKLCNFHLFRGWGSCQEPFPILLICEELWHSPHSRCCFHKASLSSPTYYQVSSIL